MLTQPKVSLSRWVECSAPASLLLKGSFLREKFLIPGVKSFAELLSVKQAARWQGHSMDLPHAQGRSPELSSVCLS